MTPEMTTNELNINKSIGTSGGLEIHTHNGELYTTDLYPELTDSRRDSTPDPTE